MSVLNKKTKINRTNLWHKFEHYEAVAHIKKPDSMRRNSITVLELIVSIGSDSGVLLDCDIFAMTDIILSLKEQDYDTSSNA